MVRGSVPRGRERANDRVPELDHVAVVERDVLEVDPGAGGQVRACSRRSNECGQAGDVVGLDMRLEDSRDRGPGPLGLLEVAVDELDVRIHDRECRVAEAPEEVARTRRLFVEKGPQDHCLAPTLRRKLLSC